MFLERPIDPPQDDSYWECDVCGARSSDSHAEKCDEYAHSQHEEDAQLEEMAASVVCPKCAEAYTIDGCPCGHVEPDPRRA